jgi:hypothetical protein
MTHLYRLYTHSPENNQRPFQMQCLTPATNISLLSSKWIIKYGRRFVTRGTSTMFFNRLCRLIITRVSSWTLDGLPVPLCVRSIKTRVGGYSYFRPLIQVWGGSIWDRRHSAVIPFVFKPTRSSQKKKRSSACLAVIWEVLKKRQKQ